MPDVLIAPPLPAGTLLHFLLAVVVLLATARVLGGLAHFIGLPAIVGELLTGAVLGPSLLGWVAPGVAAWLLPAAAEQMHMIDGIGQIGLLFLVALTGTHLDLVAVRRQRRTAAVVSLCGLLIPLAAGVGIGHAIGANLTGGSPQASILVPVFLGVAMCVTAIPVIAKTLTDMGLLHRNIGQLTLAAGMFDDAVGWLLLSIVSAAATAGVTAGLISISILSLLGFVAVAVLLGRPLVRIAMRVALRSDTAGPAVAVAVIWLLGASVVTHALGLEAIFGAFVAGIVLATIGRDVQVRLAPLRTVTLSVLAPIFLATAGLRMDLTALARPEILVTAAIVLSVAIIGKFAGAYLGARLSGLGSWEGLALGTAMNARGVVEVTVALTGLRLGVLDTSGYTVIVLVALVTSLMTPPVLRFAMNRVEQGEDERLRLVDHASWAGAPSATPAGRAL